jgi:D-tyrosyl-tRNA(Tyr) deacylase
MRAVVQRVLSAQVTVEGKVVGSIGPGLLTLLGVAEGDTETDLHWLIEKISKLRIFSDSAQKMNLSVKDVGGGHLIVSQFTLLADCTQGNRPSFTGAAKPEFAKLMYEKALQLSREMGLVTEGGVFQADMKVSLENDGPVTILLESKK